MSEKYGPDYRGRVVITWSRPGRYTFPAVVLDNVVRVEDADTGELLPGIFQLRLTVGTETEYRPGMLTVELTEVADTSGNPVRGERWWSDSLTEEFLEHRARVAALLSELGGDVLALTDDQVEQLRQLESSFTGSPVHTVTSSYYVAQMRLEEPPGEAVNAPQPEEPQALASSAASIEELDPHPGRDREC